MQSPSSTDTRAQDTLSDKVGSVNRALYRIRRNRVECGTRLCYDSAMRSRRLILCLIVLTVAVFCLVAARKLTATPKYDRIQVGVTTLSELLHDPDLKRVDRYAEGTYFLAGWGFECEEGRLEVEIGRWDGRVVVTDKRVIRP